VKVRYVRLRRRPVWRTAASLTIAPRDKNNPPAKRLADFLLRDVPGAGLRSEGPALRACSISPAIKRNKTLAFKGFDWW